MTPAADTLPQGAPHAIGAALVAALRAAPGLVGAVVLDNPLRASELTDGTRIVFFEDAADRPIEQAGVVQKRTYSFTIGVISRSSSNARMAAHTDYRAVKRALAAALPALKNVVIVGTVLREGDVSYRLENIDIGGGLVLGSFTIDYRDPV